MEGNIAPSREKYWEEKDDHQRIEKMGQALMQMAHALDEQDVLIRKLLNHQHGELGMILTPLARGKEEDWRPYWMKNPLGMENK